jgi:hypothetical protein
VAAVLLCVIAFALHIYITPYGAAVSPDSVKYISAARHLAEGKGLLHLAKNGELVPLTLWAPLYPVLLSAGALIGIEPWEFGRYLNAILFAGNILLLQWILFRIAEGNIGATIIGGIVMILSPIVLEVHTWIWTEPLAILLGFGSLLAIQRYFMRGSVLDLVLVGLLLALSLLNRYAAIAFPLTVITSIFFTRNRIGKLPRWQELLILVSISFVPLGIVMMRNASIEVGAVGRDAIYNPASVSGTIQDAIEAISVWTIPGRVRAPERYTFAIVISLVWFCLISWGIVKERHVEYESASRGLNLQELIYIFLVASILPPLVVNIFFSPGVLVDQRVLSLAYIAGVLLSISLLNSMIFTSVQASRSRVQEFSFVGLLIRGGILAVGITLIALNAVHAIDWVRNAQDDGRGFASLFWQDSKVIEYLDEHQQEAILISNVPDVLIFLTGQSSIMMPNTTEGIVELVPSNSSIREDQEPESVWIVYFRTRLNRSKVPSEVSITTDLELEPIYGSESGSIYALSNQGQ